MGHQKYHTNNFKDLRTQHNIMAFIGNGFDIQVLKALDINSKTTSYVDFYYWLDYNKRISSENKIYIHMKEEKEKGNELWSDFEIGLATLCSQPHFDGERLFSDLSEIQMYFATYLNEIITAKTLIAIGNASSKNRWAINTLSKFIADLDAEDFGNITFKEECGHYDLFNWFFVNFNYTSIFDNYIHLDKGQFDPHPYVHADRNFQFFPGFNKFGHPTALTNPTEFSSYLLTDIAHPHGLQNIPKSMLFGFDNSRQVSYSNRTTSKFMKPYWGQNDKKYSRFFSDTRLFIIFGHSLGSTDEWWWKYIVETILTSEAELIIYNYLHSGNSQQLASAEQKKIVKNRFMKASGARLSKDDCTKVTNKIFVVNFNQETNRTAFVFK